MAKSGRRAIAARDRLRKLIKARNARRVIAADRPHDENYTSGFLGREDP